MRKLIYTLTFLFVIFKGYCQPPCGTNPAAGNTCATATPICELNGYCGNTSSTYTPDAWGSTGSLLGCGFLGLSPCPGTGLINQFCGSVENDSYLQFVASNSSISFNVWVTTTTFGDGIQLIVFSTPSCGNNSVTSYYCQQITPGGGPTTVSVTGLTPGNTYYIMIDGFGGDVCDYVIGANTGISIPVDVTPATSTICSGGSVNLSATGGNGTYTWNATPQLNTTSGANVTATPPGPGTYTYTVNSATGNPLCPSSTTATSTITVTPCACTVTASNSGNVCSGGTANLFATNVSGATYSWTGPGGFTSTNQNPTGVVLPTTPGTYTYTVTADDGGTPCTSSTTITVNPNPTVVANPDITICNGTSVGATAFTSNPVGATFTWTNSNTAIGLAANGTGNQASFIGTNAGIAPISGNVTVTPTLAGCVGTTDVYQITVNPTPVMPVPANITQCGGNVSPAAFTSTTVGTTFAWTNSNTGIGLGASGTGSIATFLGTNSGSTPLSGTISVTPTANTCSGTPVNFTITINPTPVITSIADIVDCENVNIPSTVVSVSPAGANVTWTNTNTSIGLGANGTGNIPAFLSTNATANPLTGTITVNASANGCSATPELFDITINQVPVIDPVAAITQCHNTMVNSVNFTSTTPGVTFDWTNSNTSIGLGASGTGALPSFTATNATTTQTSGTITVTPTLGSCVGSPITFAINVNPVPVPTAQNNGSLCPGDALNLSSTGLPGSTYSWTGPNGFVSGIQNPTIASVSTINGGVYTVTVTAAGCTGTASTSLTVNPSVIPTITQAGPFCSDGAVVLLQASIPGGTWSGNGIVNPVTGQFAPSSATIGNNTITYTVNVVCALPATSTIVINPLPTVQFSAPILSGCQPFTAVFTDNSIPASSTVNWDFGDGSNSSLGGTINHTFMNTGCYDITLTSTSSAGCINSMTLSNYICVNPFADANFTVGNPVHTLIDPVFEMINNSTDASSYSWDFGDGTASSIANPIHEYPSSPGTYTIMLAANNASNCPDTAYLTVVIEDQLIFHVPNSFTPDGDEYNNMFEPVFYSGFDPQSYTLLIYDRWGEVLFESHNVEQGWNGAYHDGIVKEGTYTWTIQFKDSRSDKKLTYSGHLTLLK